MDFCGNQVGGNHGHGYGGKDCHDHEHADGQADSPDVSAGHLEHKPDAVLFLPVGVHRRRDGQGVDLADRIIQETVAVLDLRLVLPEELLYVFIFHHFVRVFSSGASAPGAGVNGLLRKAWPIFPKSLSWNSLRYRTTERPPSPTPSAH